MIKEKVKKSSKTILAGQVSIFDFKKINSVQKSINKISQREIESHEMPLKLTEKQKEFLKKNKIMENEGLSRILLHPDNSILIENQIKNEEGELYISHFINTEGKSEFYFYNKSPVLPWDRIFYYNPALEKIPLTKVQKCKLQNILDKTKAVKRVIHRKGDENIIIELESEIRSITPIGWELPFKNIKQIECKKDEVYFIPSEKEDLDEIQNRVKPGYMVKAMYGKEVLQGIILSSYGMNKSILTIKTDRMCTAIGRRQVLSIVSQKGEQYE